MPPETIKLFYTLGVLPKLKLCMYILTFLFLHASLPKGSILDTTNLKSGRTESEHLCLLTRAHTNAPSCRQANASTQGALRR